ncbi:hypothetical protein AVEN_1430-1 [Araneus ventricosus]|uniref:Uncharacterized protein n=1 Tax=Araneus ventricosus TaxID=182803 RepID=A0A4Y2X923_ARAVE|nr:hypothetical protein AVEN_1430-1 [Araneus ventricosus]
MTNLWQTCTLVMTNLWQACCKLKLLSGIWFDIWIEDLVSISNSSLSSSNDHMEVSETTQRDSSPNHDSTYSINVFFINIRLKYLGALFFPYQHTT